MNARSETNPFRYGALALDEAFTDRLGEIAELVADARNGQDVVVVAPRRYGKSSLIWRVQQELVADGVLVAHVNVMTTPTKEKLAEKLAKTIHEDVASVLYRARERTTGIFRGLRITPKMMLDPTTGSVSFGFDAGERPEDVDETLERFDPASVGHGDVVGIGIHTGNALRGYEVGRAARARGARSRRANQEEWFPHSPGAACRPIRSSA